MTKRLLWCVVFVFGLMAQADQRPNILFIYLDDFGWKDTGYIGSDFYETPSYPDSELPKFINVVVQINFNQNPKELMSLILKVEKKMGRIRNYLNEPRTCDIDIIDFDGKVMNSKKL